MIVRIMAEDQYRLSDDLLDDVQRLDDEMDRAIERGDAAGFQSALTRLAQFVRQRGQVVPMEEVVPSDLIIPEPDMTLDEARKALHLAEVSRPQTGV
jgi:hypothetical protein